MSDEVTVDAFLAKREKETPMSTGQALVITVDGVVHRFETSCETETGLFWLYVVSKRGEKLGAFRKSKIDSIVVEQ